VTPWKLPLIVAALIVPIVAGFYLGGGGVGVAVGALTVVALVVYAARLRPRGPIVPAPSADERRHVLLVATCPVEEPEAVERITRAGGLERGGGDSEADVLVLAPARIRFLDRWASDVEPARRAAQRNLVATVAALAKAGVEAEARVGDEDVVQAVEDQLQTFPATQVVLVSAGSGDGDGEAAAELEERLEAGFRHLVMGAAA
jgi:hypothetical protein